MLKDNDKKYEIGIYTTFSASFPFLVIFIYYVMTPNRIILQTQFARRIFRKLDNEVARASKKHVPRENPDDGFL